MISSLSTLYISFFYRASALRPALNGAGGIGSASANDCSALSGLFQSVSHGHPTCLRIWIKGDKVGRVLCSIIKHFPLFLPANVCFVFGVFYVLRQLHPSFPFCCRFVMPVLTVISSAGISVDLFSERFISLLVFFTFWFLSPYSLQLSLKYTIYLY